MTKLLLLGAGGYAFYRLGGLYWLVLMAGGLKDRLTPSVPNKTVAPGTVIPKA